MAFGDNNEKKYYEPTVYSAYAMSNTDGVDPSALNFSFNNGLLKITIAPMLPTAKPGDRNLWDKDNSVSIWLTHTKARMFAEEIREMIAHPGELPNAGVPSGAEGLLTYSDGKELGATSPCLIIRKLNAESGDITSTYAYQFKSDYHYSIRNFDTATKDFDKHFFESLEVEQFLTLLDTYYTNMSGSIAYGIMYGAKYDIQREHTKTKLIMDKLGIDPPEYGKGNSGAGYNNRSFFNGGNKNESQSSPAAPASTGGMRQSTLDDIAG